MASCDEVEWRARVQRAASVGELIHVVDAFLASRVTSENLLSRVSPAVHLGSSVEIKEAVIRLSVARTTAGNDAETDERVKRMFVFYTAAASRLGQLEFELGR